MKMKLRGFGRLALAAIVAAFAFDYIAVALAQDAAAAAPEMTWFDFVKGWLRANAEYILGPVALPFVMAQARAWFPWLDNLGVLSVLGNYIAGNYRAAKNAG